MRKIKFRTWDKIVSKMVEIGELVVGETTTAWIKNVDSSSHMIVHGESGIFMQYTGLKDKNGKEIYEGDILTTTDIPELPPKIGAVEWLDETAMFNVSSSTRGRKKVEDCEIIGNIYENPELLK